MDVEFLQDYLTESKELVQKAQEDTLRLEADPGDTETLASIFRAFHTIKGGAGFLEANHLVEWAHDLENLLDKLRSHTLPITSARIDAILKGIDVIERMFRDLADERQPDVGPDDLSQTIRVLTSITETQNSDADMIFGSACTEGITSVQSDAIAATVQTAGHDGQRELLTAAAPVPAGIHAANEAAPA